jgi:hypothetical protein
MDRLMHEGFSLVHDPELAVHRSQRPDYPAYRRQMFGYGRGRGEQTVLSGKLKPVSLAPSAFLAYLLLLPWLIGCRAGWFPALPLLSYLALVFGASLWGARAGRDWRLAPWLLLVYPTLHLVYGAGVICGLVRPRFRGRVNDAAGIEVQRVKKFGDPL